MQKIGKKIEEESVYDIQRVKINDEIVEFNIPPEISIIANNFEKYLSFRIGKHLQFIDSFHIMSSSLDRLASNLPNISLFILISSLKISNPSN